MLKERLADLLRAEALDQDLQADRVTDCLLVCAMREDGGLYEVGRVNNDSIHQDPAGAMRAIDCIKSQFMRAKL
jgi:hypothetical protein